MQDHAALVRLLPVLDTLAGVARMMHPGRLPDLVASLGDQDMALDLAIRDLDASSPVSAAAGFALQACAGLRAAPNAENPILQALRSMRQYHRSLEALAALTDTHPTVGRYLLGSTDKVKLPLPEQRRAGD